MSKPKFVPKEGQVDYTNIRYCPVINCVVTYKNKILLAKRSSDMTLYPGYWGTIDGFLDDNKSIEEKTLEELEEELGLKNADIASIKRGQPLIYEESKYAKTWLVMPVLVKVKTSKFKLNDESETAGWFKLSELPKIQQVPNQELVIAQFFSA